MTRLARAAALLLPLCAAAASLLAATPASASAGDPIGSVDVLRMAEAGFVLEGWAADPDVPGAPVELHVYEDGVLETYFSDGASSVRTGVPRPDVAAVHPWAGRNAGFRISLDVRVGSTVCVYAINRAAGAENTTLGCRTPDASPSPGDPVGVLDEITEVAPGLVRVRGWAADPDTRRPVVVRIGQLFSGFPPLDALGETPADRARPDVATVFPAFGGETGFDVRIALGRPGVGYPLCVWALNVGPGTNNTTLGCTEVDVSAAAASPIVGRLDVVQSGSAQGWAYDTRRPGEPVTIRLHHLQAGSGGWPVLVERTGTTGVARPDVAAVIAGAGPNQGFSILTEGMTTTGIRPPRLLVAVYALDPGGGPDVLLGYA